MGAAIPENRADLRASIGRRIRALREARQLTQQDLAAAIDLDKSGLSRIEAGERGIDSVILADLADALGVSLREFFAGDPLTFARSSSEDAASDDVVADAVQLLDEIMACEALVRVE